MKIEISYGELVDKITILQLKQKYCTNSDKLLNINKELNYLTKTAEDIMKNADCQQLYKKLFASNEKIWMVEDKLREYEKNKYFGEEFIKAARAVYYNNDERSRIKKEINLIFNSNFIEEKVYNHDY